MCILTGEITFAKGHQMENRISNVSVKDLIGKFTQQVEKCIPHYQEICWIRHTMKTDIAMLCQDELLIFTDFAAVMALRAF